MARVTIISDAWVPQINGVVTTLVNTVKNLEIFGHSVTMIEPGRFSTWPCPTYPEIPLSRTSKREMARMIEDSRPDFALIAVEGPLGLAARRALVAAGIPFSSALFTRFHDYLWQRFRVPHGLTLRGLDWFHRPSGRILTPTASMQLMLQRRGLDQSRTWRPGIDRTRFKPARGPATGLVAGLPPPIHLYVGRLAVEKNIEAFLDLDLAGSKVLVGDGPLRGRLTEQYPGAVFLGYRTADEIAEICSASDVLVFPSRTDTFGHVMVEALACGLPVAAYPVQGPLDILTDPAVGAMDANLGLAIEKALRCSGEACTEFAGRTFSWDASTRDLLHHLVPANGPPAEAAVSAAAGRRSCDRTPSGHTSSEHRLSEHAAASSVTVA